MNCPACDHAVTEDRKSCPHCGSPVTAASATAAGTTLSHGPVEGPPSGPHDRFEPGKIVVGRYRIVRRIGLGGMGEVYHADDLSLDQAVALKFLPESLSKDPERLRGLKAEVRIARQIAHPHVCRVYDLTEADDLCFLSMEYVRGEDLRTLLQRVGRLPPERAAEVAWQLASGLAAAHDRGVLHRDLKPANIIIDERGRARILDFGIAAVAGSVGGADIRSGTPAYMAPEQREGREVTERSDLFSLGLVLYELFTGKKPFGGPDPTLPPRPPSKLVHDLDDSVDRIILACLDPDPRLRPPSALAVRAAFPVGDMLSMAMARGETPNPELVAEAGDFRGLSPAVAWSCLAAVTLALVGTFLGVTRPRLTAVVPLPKSPAILASDAREMLETFGYGTPRDSTFGFSRHLGYLDQVLKAQEFPDWPRVLGNGEPSVIRFWYRESPHFLVSYRTTEFFTSEQDPPQNAPGMVSVELDTLGRLRRLEATAPEFEEVPASSKPPDWGPLFAAARLDLSRFRSTEPRLFPSGFADQRAAWDGRYPDAEDIAIRVEAASLKGRIVSFRIMEPWTLAEAAGSAAPAFVRASDVVRDNGLRILHVAIQFLLLLGLGLLARRNLTLGRGDTRVAARLSTILFGLVMLQWLLATHHVPERAELELFFGGLYRAFFTFALSWLLYVGIEPYARRLWPRSLTSWVRLLSGRTRDPLVGRDILVGCVLGITGGWLGFGVSQFAPESLKRFAISRPDLPNNVAELWALRGPREAVAAVLSVQVNIATHVLFLLMALLLFRFLSRRTWIAASLHWSLYVLLFSSFGLAGVAVWITLWLAVLFRFGLLAALVGTFTTALLAEFPLTTNAGAWQAYATWAPFSVCAALTLFGFTVSLGQQSAFRDPMAEP